MEKERELDFLEIEDKLYKEYTFSCIFGVMKTSNMKFKCAFPY